MILTRSAVRKSGRKLVAPLSNHTQKRRNNNKRSHKVTIDSVKPITAKVGKSNNFYVVEDSVEHLVRLIKDNSNVVVKFFSPHCPHCIAMAVPFMQMAQTHKNITFVKVNIDAIPDAMYAFNIEAFPTFVSFRNGQKIGEFVGGSEQNIKNAVEKF